MEAFRALVELLINRLWAADVAAAAGAAGSAKDFDILLRDLEHHAAARLLWSKPLGQPLTERDLQSARAFLTRIYGEEGTERKWAEKANSFKQLSPESLAVAIVLCNGDKALRNATDTIRALCKGAEKIARWSPWPHDARLKALVQQLQQQATTSTAVSPAQPARSPHTNPPQKPLVLKCSSCGTPLDLELTYTQASSGESLNLWTAAAPPTSGDRSNQPSTSVPPLPPTSTSPAAPTDATTAAELSHVVRSQQAYENRSAISGRKKRRVEEPGSTLEETAVAQTPMSQPSPSSVPQRSSGPGHTSPALTPPPAAQPNAVTAYRSHTSLVFGHFVVREVIYRLGDFLSFIEAHFPQTIEFTPETIALGSVRCVSVRIRGVWFQVTPAWLKARGLLSSSGLNYVPQRILSSAILDYLREFQSYGFQHTIPVGDLQNLEDLTLATHWWFGDKDGDGTVWPIGFGDLLIKWWRPGSLRDFIAWLDGVDYSL
ncbi:hypothetical protein B0J18DRAFT_439573 [Chaetomium sp. MPI-SDFR-AT-0129]|nr:hypothetical protein B0J18DRAFT_439573 [Chaetomium sp. MPI-SDFR-AT-0129]